VTLPDNLRPTARQLIKTLEEFRTWEMSKVESERLYELLGCVRIDVEEKWAAWDGQRATYHD